MVYITFLRQYAFMFIVKNCITVSTNVTKFRKKEDGNFLKDSCVQEVLQNTWKTNGNAE